VKFPYRIAVVMSIFLSFTVHCETLILEANRWLDVSSGQISSPASLDVTDRKITAVDPVSLPNNAAVIELGDMTLFPSLMDLHTRLALEDFAGWQYEPATKNSAFYAMRSVRNAKKTLMAGFTTIREVGSYGFIDVKLGKAIDLGWLDGPRVISSGYAIGITGGHYDVTGFKSGALVVD
jgi:imidazolonepropionase-like amidohydrolase